jgi:hypothetical protein
MEHIANVDEIKDVTLQRAAKCAFAVGADVYVYAVRDESAIYVKFPDNDRARFDPEYNTMHALELLGVARSNGFVTHTAIGNGVTYLPYVVRVVYSTNDVRVQIGASKWFVTSCLKNTASATRRALVDAFCAYYDEAIAPYTAA